jgi:hypothetical protein
MIHIVIDWLIVCDGVRLCLRTAATNGPIFHLPGDMWARRAMWQWWCRLGITPDSSTRALWQSYQQRHLGQVGLDEGMRILPNSIRNTSRESYDMGLRLYFPSMEGMLRIFIALKKPLSRPGLNPRPLGPVASTLTTTPPRRRLI